MQLLKPAWLALQLAALLIFGGCAQPPHQHASHDTQPAFEVPNAEVQALGRIEDVLVSSSGETRQQYVALADQVHGTQMALINAFDDFAAKSAERDGELIEAFERYQRDDEIADHPANAKAEGTTPLADDYFGYTGAIVWADDDRSAEEPCIPCINLVEDLQRATKISTWTVGRTREFDFWVRKPGEAKNPPENGSTPYVEYVRDGVVIGVKSDGYNRKAGLGTVVDRHPRADQTQPKLKFATEGEYNPPAPGVDVTDNEAERLFLLMLNDDREATKRWNRLPAGTQKRIAHKVGQREFEKEMLARENGEDYESYKLPRDVPNEPGTAIAATPVQYGCSSSRYSAPAYGNRNYAAGCSSPRYNARSYGSGCSSPRYSAPVYSAPVTTYYYAEPVYSYGAGSGCSQPYSPSPQYGYYRSAPAVQSYPTYSAPSYYGGGFGGGSSCGPYGCPW